MKVGIIMERAFKSLKTMAEIDSLIHENTLAFLYISQPNCSVCHGLLPQIEQLMEHYPKIKTVHINTDDIPEVAGKFSIFTVPVLLLFVNGKEYIREARIVHTDLLKEKLDKIYKHFV